MTSYGSVFRGRRLKLNNRCDKEMNCVILDKLMNDMGGKKKSRAQ